MTWRHWVVIVGVFLAGLAAGLALVVGVNTTCLDRRDYAPGRNTYRLVWCDDMPSYRDEARKWSGN